MKAKNLPVAFDDTPEMEQMAAAIREWQGAGLPDWCQHPATAHAQKGMVEPARPIGESLAEVHGDSQKSHLEAETISWLYDLIRANVKRGRVFDLGEVLKKSSADCLGYAKLFTVLGRLFGVDAGVIEVVIDNAGRYVPHTACLVKLADGQTQFVDLWYGSKNIRHRKLGLRARRGKAWQIEDLEPDELTEQVEVSYLPDACVNAITLYIRGNRRLNQQDFKSAITCYSKAIRLYPENARIFYNRAIAYENLGEREKAEADYTQAFRDDSALIRLLAREHDEVINLIDLDARGISSQAQEIYLLHKGLITGKEVEPAEIARMLGLSETETSSALSLAEGLASNVILRNEVTKNLFSEEDSTDSSLRSEGHEHSTFRAKP